jgi:hypothetical protein
MENFPLEIVKHIISYDKRFIIRHGKIIQINQIDKNDKRYNLLLNIPEKEYCGGCTYIYIKINENTYFYM